MAKSREIIKTSLAHNLNLYYDFKFKSVIIRLKAISIAQRVPINLIVENLFCNGNWIWINNNKSNFVNKYKNIVFIQQLY